MVNQILNDQKEHLIKLEQLQIEVSENTVYFS